jgi:Family of unknown function (DUF5996)
VSDDYATRPHQHDRESPPIFREPAFYSYTAPGPEGLPEHPLSPEAASWLLEGGTALLTYEEARNTFSPMETPLDNMR